MEIDCAFMHILEKLDVITSKNNSLLCIGLDTDLAKLPAHLRKYDNPVLTFNRAIIEATADIVQAYKLNLAFYEALGRNAWSSIRSTLEAVPADVVTIGDAKRGDIGNTSLMYAKALFDDFGFDATTVAPYMGFDSVEPFLRYKEKGVFLLALTSNTSSRDFQYLKINDTPLYQHVVRTALEWNSNGNLGFVVGATHPSELRELRQMVGNVPLLIPGLGAQGGEIEASVRAGIDDAGRRALYNSSRGVIYAGQNENFALDVRKAALSLRDEINSFRPQTI